MPPEVQKVLRDHCWSLRNRIREADSLSEPCPPGKWRWADIRAGGHGKKPEAQLAADRARNRALAVTLRAELAVFEAYLAQHEAGHA